jgi:hypothetical protein
MITVTCASCSRKLEVNADRAGQLETCPHCKQAVLVPNPFVEAEQQVNIAQVIKALPGSASNPFRGMDRAATLAAVRGETIKPYRLVGILGAAILVAGTFLPIYADAAGTTQNSFEVGSLGSILLTLAVMGLSLTVTRSTHGLLAVALGTLTLILANLFQEMIGGRQVHWGWSVLVVGALFLLGATIWGEKLPLKRRRAD